ncbi:MAG: hypothetical protein P1V36_02040 [Planctomycetota bacterium]|nr:hypothetical protein [Planctomycetota bacterium]
MWSQSRYLMYRREEPEYDALVEELLWHGWGASREPLQPVARPPAWRLLVIQDEPGILQWRSARPKAHITLDLRPGKVSAVQVERFTLDGMGMLASPWSVATVVDPKARASRVVLIRGTQERPWDPARVRTLLAVEGAAFTGFTIDRTRGRVYVLDAHGWRVWRIDDTDGDEVPDHPASDAVVPPRLFTMPPKDLPITAISWLERDGVRGLVPLVGAEFAGALRTTVQGTRIWQDTDDDGVMDAVGTWPGK